MEACSRQRVLQKEKEKKKKERNAEKKAGKY